MDILIKNLLLSHTQTFKYNFLFYFDNFFYNFFSNNEQNDLKFKTTICFWFNERNKTENK